MATQTSLLQQLLHSLEDSKALDITTLDVRGQTTITDYMIICNGRASRHTKAIAQKLIEDMKAAGLPVLSETGMDTGEWVLLDFADFVVHIMQPDARAFYHLEGLWQPTPPSDNV